MQIETEAQVTNANAGRVDCVGILRFSVISTQHNRFKAWEGVTFDDYKNTILDESRLARRFELFESITLPSFDSQTDKTFALMVVAPRLLSERWRERLSLLAADRPYMRVYYMDETNFRMNRLTPLITRDLISADTFCTYRIDDDDAVSEDFIERLRRYVRTEFCGLGVSFTRGFFMQVNASSDKFGFDETDKKNVSVGLAYITNGSNPQSVFDVAEKHPHYHKHRPVIMDGKLPAFVLTNHDYNDTGSARTKIACNFDASGAQAFLAQKKIFVNLENLRRK